MAKLATSSARTIIRLSSKTRTPKAKQFLASYFALDRPNTSHLFLTKGVIDFLLGLIIGILIGIIIATMTGTAAVA